MSANRSSRSRGRPAETPDDRENQLINLAYNLAEKKLTEGTASSQELTHFLKMGSARERLEQQRLQRENLLLSAKVDQMASAKRIEELYEQALGAMRTYAGRDIVEYDDDYDE